MNALPKSPDRAPAIHGAGQRAGHWSTTLVAIAVAAFAFSGCDMLADGKAQPAPGKHRIGFVNVGPATLNAANIAAFRAGLAELGYVEGRNLVLDERWGDLQPQRLPQLVSDLLALKPAVILSGGGSVTALAVKAATSTVPVVFITGDPVAEKLVATLARPGGNLTGLAVIAAELEPKRLELLTQIVPGIKRVAVVLNPSSPATAPALQDLEAATRRLGLELALWKARDARELEEAFGAIAAAKVDGLFVVGDVVLGFERQRIVDFATRQRLPGVFFWREFAVAGGLASYATSLPAVYRRAAGHVDKILKGAKPGDLAIEQPTTFELVINRNTAKALGITIPPSVLINADVIP